MDLAKLLATQAVEQARRHPQRPYHFEEQFGWHLFPDEDLLAQDPAVFSRSVESPGHRCDSYRFPSTQFDATLRNLLATNAR
jgi:hypothetical protein